MLGTPEAFLLLSLPQTSLTASGRTENGNLALEFVTLPTPDAYAQSKQDREVYLVLKINATEIALDPATVIRRTDAQDFRTYVFEGTSEPGQMVIRVMVPRNPRASDEGLLEKVNTFESILEQYVDDFQGPAPPMPQPEVTTPSAGLKGGLGAAKGNQDLRGHLVMINEDTGEVISEVEKNFKIREDPILHTKGHEEDPVVIDVPESTAAQDGTVHEAFARIVPPDQRNWVTKGASIVSHAISMTTNLLVTTITSASDYYVNSSAPSPHHSAANTPSGLRSKSPANGPPPLPPRAPPRALVFLTSEKSRKGMATVHTMSGEAVKISTKTVSKIDDMIRRAVGAKPKRAKALVPQGPSGAYGAPGGSALAPPPFSARSPSPGFGGGKSPSTSAPPAYVQESYFPPPSQAPPGPPPLPPRLSSKDKILISAELILSTLDDSMHKVIDSGSASLSSVMGHKYGPEAAESTRLMTGTVKNVGLVYVDVRGIGRRALLRRAGKTFVKARLSSKTTPGMEQHQ